MATKIEGEDKRLYEIALEFATEAHGDQKRKYTFEPYINHLVAVAKILIEMDQPLNVIIAGLLHDIVEDTEITLRNIEKVFGFQVGLLVDEVTDVYTKENYPNLNRRERKILECARIADISSSGKTIKLADLVDNTSSIVEHDKSFAKTYLIEKENMLNILHGGDSDLLDSAMYILLDSKRKLKM